MGRDSSISWLHRPGTVPRTWNPQRGCFPTEPSCKFCYVPRSCLRGSGAGGAYDGLIKLGKDSLTGAERPKWTGEIKTLPAKLDEPFGWRDPSTVFVNSTSDLFYERFDNDWIASVMGVIALQALQRTVEPHLYILLSHKLKRAKEWFEWVAGRPEGPGRYCIERAAERSKRARKVYEVIFGSLFQPAVPWPLPGLWFYASVGTNKEARENLPRAAQIPAVVRGISLEPLLEDVDLRPALRGDYDWDRSTETPFQSVFIGGESGDFAWVDDRKVPLFRSTNIAHLRSALSQVGEFPHVAGFLKQVGSRCFAETDEDARGWAGGVVAGRTHRWILRTSDKKGEEPLDWPPELRLRQWPEAA